LKAFVPTCCGIDVEMVDENNLGCMDLSMYAAGVACVEAVSVVDDIVDSAVPIADGVQ
jgi:hypothetical protein